METILGIYGPSEYLDLPTRTDKGSGKDVFRTLGKVDYGHAGPFHSSKKLSYIAMVERFHFLSKSKKKNFLWGQFKEERKLLPAILSNWYKNHGEEPIFEIANEPNLFPYIEPDLYAAYYMLWVDEIRKHVPGAVIMNGGLWVHELLPKQITKKLSLIRVTERNTYHYWEEFLDCLKPGYYPDVVNLHIYPMVKNYADVRKAIDNLPFFLEETYKPFCISEAGNLNSFTMPQTVQFLRELYSVLDSKPSVQRVFHFQTQYSQRHFQLFHSLHAFYQKQSTIRKTFNWLSHLFNGKDDLFSMLVNYIKNPPIQHLETAEGLNECGKLLCESLDRSGKLLPKEKRP